MPEWSTAEWVSVLSTAFAAFAAGASWVTIVLDRRRQREARRPNVAGGVTIDPPTGAVSVRFANAGPGLAVQIAYLIEDETTGKKSGFVSSLKGESRCIWVCRDVDNNLHLWSHDARYEQIPAKDYLDAESGTFQLGTLFKRMYPDRLPSRAREIEKGDS